MERVGGENQGLPSARETERDDITKEHERERQLIAESPQARVQ